MKKLLILALVALVAGSAFAATEPVFSGNFDYSIQFDFDAKEIKGDDNAGKAKLDLGAVIDDYNKVTVTLEAAGGAALTLNQYTMTTDITGALGVGGPVGVSITWGAVNLEAAEYQGVAGYADSSYTQKTASTIGMKLAITLGENITLVTLIAPESYFGASGWTTPSGVTEPIFGADLQFVGLVDGLDFNLYFVMDKNLDGAAPFVGMETGLSAGYTMDALKFGLAFQYYDRGAGSDLALGVAVAYTLAEALTLGLAYGDDTLSNMADGGLGFNATWMATDALDLYFAGVFAFTGTFSFDSGVVFDLGATTYTLGYEYGTSHFKAPDTGVSGLFFKVAAAY